MPKYADTHLLKTAEQPITSGTHFARDPDMSALLVLLLVVVSVALSIGLSRLAVGEMFRLVSSGRLDRPRAHDDLRAR